MQQVARAASRKETSMPSKERAHSQDKSTPKQRLPWHTVQTPETVDPLHQPPTTVQRAVQAPRSLTPQDVSRLQRAYGNQAVLQLPGVGGPPRAAGSEGPVQRQEEEEEPLQAMALQRQEQEEEEEPLQAKADVQRVGLEGGPVPPEVASTIARARRGGQPLDGAVQAQMGEAMGYDFGGVRVHTDAGADKLNKQLSAKAFTTGADIFFQRGAYEPGSSGGRELIAHELSHVVQQSSGQLNGGGNSMTVRPAADAFEQEADRVSDAASRSMNTSAQRQTPDEEELLMQEEGNVQTQVGESKPVLDSEDLETRIKSARGGGKRLIAHELTHVVQQQSAELLQREMGTYQPLAIGRAAGDYIAEIESGESIGSGGIRFSGISSCIAVIGRMGNILKGVHLSLYDAEMHSVADVTPGNLLQAVQNQLAGCTSFFKMGMIGDWEGDAPNFMQLIGGYTTLYDGELQNISSVMVDPKDANGVILTDKEDKVLYPARIRGSKYTLHSRL
jgi:hypothetical protein